MADKILKTMTLIVRGPPGCGKSTLINDIKMSVKGYRWSRVVTKGETETLIVVREATKDG